MINPDIRVIKNDELSLAEIAALAPDHIIVSPGPGRPADAGICEEVIDTFKDKTPILESASVIRLFVVPYGTGQCAKI